MSKIKKIILVVVLCFVAPALASLGVRAAGSQPGSWRTADWSSSGLLPEASTDREAAVYVMAARTGGLKGALAVHSWIVTKDRDAVRYTRYDKVGWGSPIRTNSYPADGRWYSNTPDVLLALHGGQAARLIPQIEAAVEAYPFAGFGDYRIWPGPNSNSFVAHVLRQVPELELALPPEAVGRDFRPFGDFVTLTPDWRNLEVSLGGYAGFAIGTLYGLELRLAGLVFGLDVMRPALKLPGFGRIGMERDTGLVS
ncbi:DUF3750 domain-containing protein [Hoeflea alexandrii]|uniref:DUF3750 domain-containing protein n=1 Tax=Hoeflea alexandrii TaxID=288436 RepID=A0ABT1CUZ4_9HYPH|nr:DUF3750 domain-containing protein [Hoeflea alexandrii]MCO6410020.1 DUF3750 domain-containing protein [Hoeflea alexandrii]MCY0152998.1 DUF3750 domain-containing protein [Hoeflea alexandrii]